MRAVPSSLMSAERVGAVNTFWYESGRLHGDNTDVGGFDAAARALLGGETKGARIVVLGSGGAAAAVIAAAEQWTEAHVAIFARHFDHASKLARRFRDVARAEKSSMKRSSTRHWSSTQPRLDSVRPSSRWTSH